MSASTSRQTFGGAKRTPSLSGGSTASFGLSNQQLPPNSLFYLFNNTSTTALSSAGNLGSNLSTTTTSTTGTTTTATNLPASTSTPGTTTNTPAPSLLSPQSSTSTTGNNPINAAVPTASLPSSTIGGDQNKEDDNCGTILMEIDKGIRSGNIGDQVESILFFSHLIKYQPTPLVVNSVIVKLSDIFRNTNNTVKYRILKVFQECSHEIHKIANIDDVLKRIHSVILSNDPIARSLALRVLGSVPQCIVDKLYIHHSIRSCMQSHDQVEVEAVIFIIDKLCEISPLFSDSVIEKIHKTIQSVETPPITKLKYTRLFRHMHHSHSISNQSREMLVGLLSLYPSVLYVTAILDTLTSLASKHILYIDQHIKFLTTFGLSDPRVKVKVTSLKCLLTLSKISPHSQYPLTELFDILEQSPQNYWEIKYHALVLLSNLSITLFNDIKTNTKGLSLLFQYSLDYDLTLSELCIDILVNIVNESIVLSSNNDSSNNSKSIQSSSKITEILSDQEETGSSEYDSDEYETDSEQEEEYEETSLNEMMGMIGSNQEDDEVLAEDETDILIKNLNDDSIDDFGNSESNSDILETSSISSCEEININNQQSIIVSNQSIEEESSSSSSSSSQSVLLKTSTSSLLESESNKSSSSKNSSPAKKESLLKKPIQVAKTLGILKTLSTPSSSSQQPLSSNNASLTTTTTTTVTTTTTTTTTNNNSPLKAIPASLIKRPLSQQSMLKPPTQIKIPIKPDIPSPTPKPITANSTFKNTMPSSDDDNINQSLTPTSSSPPDFDEDDSPIKMNLDVDIDLSSDVNDNAADQEKESNKEKFTNKKDYSFHRKYHTVANHPVYKPTLNDPTDKVFAEFLNVTMKKVLPPTIVIPTPVVRLSANKYKWGDTIVNMRCVNNIIVVRVGGGWMTLKDFLIRYNSVIQASDLDKMPENTSGTNGDDMTKLQIQKTFVKDGQVKTSQNLSPSRNNGNVVKATKTINAGGSTSPAGSQNLRSGTPAPFSRPMLRAGTPAPSDPSEGESEDIHFKLGIHRTSVSSGTLRTVGGSTPSKIPTPSKSSSSSPSLPSRSIASPSSRTTPTPSSKFSLSSPTKSKPAPSPSPSSGTPSSGNNVSSPSKPTIKKEIPRPSSSLSTSSPSSGTKTPTTTPPTTPTKTTSTSKTSTPRTSSLSIGSSQRTSSSAASPSKLKK